MSDHEIVRCTECGRDTSEPNCSAELSGYVKIVCANRHSCQPPKWKEIRADGVAQGTTWRCGKCRSVWVLADYTRKRKRSMFVWIVSGKAQK